MGIHLSTEGIPYISWPIGPLSLSRSRLIAYSGRSVPVPRSAIVIGPHLRVGEVGRTMNNLTATPTRLITYCVR
jgi:hypothetical protein